MLGNNFNKIITLQNPSCFVYQLYLPYKTSQLVSEPGSEIVEQEAADFK